MKRFNLIIAIMLTFAIGLKCQNYVPFPTENVYWNVFYAGTCQEKAPDSVLLQYTIRGDTTINNLAYKKLCLETGNQQNPKITAIGGLREKDKKIYYIGRTILHDTGNQEYLLYDFTRQIGDTIKHNPQGWFYSVILNIDSVLMDGTYRKRYEVDNRWFYQNPDYIIEGIGSVKNGLLGHISDIPTCGTHHWEFVCFREKDEIKYVNSSFNDCFPYHLVMGNTMLKVADTQVKFYPNPFIRHLEIENTTGKKDLSLKIIDINGHTLIVQPLAEGKSAIDLQVQPGIYGVTVSNNHGQILSTQKVIKR